jgi:hypothetical protein
MKSEIDDTDYSPEYPLLKRHHANGLIVMFTDYKTGFCVFAPIGCEKDVGAFSVAWDEDSFNLFFGSVRLQN